MVSRKECWPPWVQGNTCETMLIIVGVVVYLVIQPVAKHSLQEPVAFLCVVCRFSSGFGDIATYPGKLKLILSGFSEAATAAHAIYPLVHPDQALHFEYSTTQGVPGGKLE